MTDRHLRLDGHRLVERLCVRYQKLPIFEFRQVSFDRIVEMHTRLLVQHHQRYGGDRPGHRVDAGDEVALPRPLGFDVGVPGAVEKGEFSMTRDEHRTTRPAPGVAISLHPPLQSRQPRLVEAEVPRVTNWFATKLTHRANVLSQAKVLWTILRFPRIITIVACLERVHCASFWPGFPSIILSRLGYRSV
ncbi:hypothetical protein GGI64_002024 [Rhizobium leguminosarum]|uniref:Uncharacterized protein n=1 Tax=Rhizobium leguminosarum TaxID=384 RepID=A0A7Z0DX34_RHILE|nr:hypothetical protein [Rhizobium leguminosarum]